MAAHPTSAPVHASRPSQRRRPRAPPPAVWCRRQPVRLPEHHLISDPAAAMPLAPLRGSCLERATARRMLRAAAEDGEATPEGGASRAVSLRLLWLGTRSSCWSASAPTLRCRRWARSRWRDDRHRAQGHPTRDGRRCAAHAWYRYASAHWTRHEITVRVLVRFKQCESKYRCDRQSLAR